MFPSAVIIRVWFGSFKYCRKSFACVFESAFRVNVVSLSSLEELLSSFGVLLRDK